ncbi:MAG: enoyl-CoA hydratase/isomerase family protein [Deltaproteobacteria bacterium]|nr:enoyl-CoA hydratase/isomerase family protein [Deltaproteobacteria bacterium]
MIFETIQYETKDNCGIVTLNRPKVYNAINGRCIQELHSLLDEVRRTPSIRVLILTGAPRFFCAGADIGELNKLDGATGALDFSRRYQRLFQAVEHFEKPTMAGISGFALGGGCELALSCDLRILSEGAELGLPEIDIGAFPAGGGTQTLSRLIGMGKAKEVLFTGRRIGAQEALSLGLANQVVPEDQVLAETLRWAARLSEKSPTALTALKRAMNTGANMDLASALAFEAETFAALSSHRNFKEGVAAFLQKRRPNFTEE